MRTVLAVYMTPAGRIGTGYTPTPGSRFADHVNQQVSRQMLRRKSKLIKFRAKDNPRTRKLPNPYALALLTGATAGAFSAIGGYFVAGFQAEYALVQEQYEYRVQIYSAFLEKAGPSKDAAVGQLLGIGVLADYLATDSEIQSLEDRIATLLERQDPYELYWRLSADLGVLRLNGSSRVGRICNDLLMASLSRDEEIAWADYPPKLAALREELKRAAPEDAAYGWEERISVHERQLILTVAKLMEALTLQLRAEIQNPSI